MIMSCLHDIMQCEKEGPSIQKVHRETNLNSRANNKKEAMYKNILNSKKLNVLHHQC